MLNKNRILGLFVAILMLASASNLMAQSDNVGVGTTTPQPSAILDIANPYSALTGARSKGVLVPAVTQLQRDLMEADYNDTLANGLLIYEPDSGNFWYYKYDVPTPASAPYGDWIKIGTTSSSSASGMPAGGIIMWSGTIASIPAGWALCDGASGTPDLTDKFIISVASSAENPGTAPVPGFYVDVEAGGTVAPDRRFFKLAYIMKL
ncbi:MAG: hypothetical protein ACPGU4_02410 [Flavobacteriales bacterium]